MRTVRLRRGALPRLLLVAALAASPMLLGGSVADANQLDATAWWSVANAGPVSVPAPPDVTGDDLLVQGTASGAGLAGAEPIDQAVAAVSFTLANGEEPGPLVLQLTQNATVPPAVKACRITAAFQPAKNGQWSAVPSHDCSDSVAGSVSPDGASIAFANTARFFAGGRLAVLLVPAAPTRLVLAPPTTGALLVTDRSAVPVETPPPAPATDAAVASPAPDVGAPTAPAPLSSVSPVSPEVAAPPSPAPSSAASPRLPGFAGGATSVSFPTDSTSGKALTAAVLFLFLAPLALRGQFSRRTRPPTATATPT